MEIKLCQQVAEEAKIKNSDSFPLGAERDSLCEEPVQV